MNTKEKRTDLLAISLRVIAKSMENEYRAGVLLAAAQRLDDLDKIAEFFRREAIKNAPKKAKGVK